MQILKRCTTCQIDQTLDNFRRQSKNKDGLKYTCKTCDDDRAKKRYGDKKDHIINKVKEWQGKNPDKIQLYKHRSYVKRKDTTVPPA